MISTTVLNDTFSTALNNHEVNELYTSVTSKYQAHWRRIGIFLKVDGHILNSIACNNKSDEECCSTLWKEILKVNVDTITKLSLFCKVIPATCYLQDVYNHDSKKYVQDTWGSFHAIKIANVAKMFRTQKHVSEEQKTSEAIAKVQHRRTERLNTDNLKRTLHKYVSNCEINKYISELFKDEEDNLAQKTILIEGAPGIGKTVLSREIAFQWANEKLLRKKLFLFLIHLRDPRIPQIKSLHEFVSIAIRLSTDDELVKLTVDCLKSTSGKCCTIVLDGYDEISKEAIEDSFIGKIIEREDELKNCSLVITSRPTASVDLHGYVNHRIEILGFTEKDREEYIYKNLKVEEIEKIQIYLQNNPLINDLCYIPLNMTMLLHLFLTHDNLELQTQTDINSKFIYITISRFISKLTKTHVNIASPDDLLEPYKQQFIMLCKLAFDLFSTEKVVFDNEVKQKILRDFNMSDVTWSTLGLLKEVNYYTMPENKQKKSYSYLHISMQECLAAHYIASSKDVEDNFLTCHFWDLKYINIGVMYVGLTKGKSPIFKKFLCGDTGIFSRLFGASKSTVYDKVEKVHLFNCLLEAKNDELSESLQLNKVLDTKIIDLSDHGLQLKDIHTLSLFLSRSANHIWQKLDLSDCFIKKEYLENFSTIITSKSKFSLASISIIDLSGNYLIESVDVAINLINCFRVKKLIIDDNTAEDLTFKESLISSMSKVKEVVISSSTNANHFLINYNSSNDENHDILNQLEFKGRIHVWNAKVILLKTNLIENSTLNVYEENLPDEEIVDTISELKMICAEKNQILTYVVQSPNNVFIYGAEFYQISQGFKSESFKKCGYVNLRLCNIDSNKFTQIFSSLHLDELDVSQCANLEYIEILKCCIMKHLIVSDNSICDKQICDLILIEANKILNFQNGVPLLLSTSEANSLFIFNCPFNDLIIEDYDFVFSKLCFSSIKLNEGNIKSFLMICKSNKSQVSVFEMNLTNGIINDVLTELGPLQDKSYVLTSSTNLIAYKAKQQQIMEAIAKCSAITTLQLIDCELCFLKNDPLGNHVSNSSQNWELIDLSGCNIGDDGCLNLSDCFSDNKNTMYIKVLNLSSNCLTSNAVVTILEIFRYHVIKSLIISGNDIPFDTFNELLYAHLLAKKNFLNFAYKIPSIVFQSMNGHEICNVYYALETSNMEAFQSQTYQDEILHNLHYVYTDQNKCKIELFFSFLLISPPSTIVLLEEDVMNQSIINMIMKLVKLRHDEYIRFSKVHISHTDITHKFCKNFFSFSFNDEISFNFIEELDLSSHRFSLACVPTLIESFQYCVIKRLVLSNNKALDIISTTILKDSYAGKKILNFIERIPLTVIIKTDTEEKGNSKFNINAITYLRNYQITKELAEDLVIDYQVTSSHTFLLFDCLSTNDLNIISSFLNIAPFIKICIFETRLSNDSLSAEHLNIHGNRIQYVLAAGIKFVACSAAQFQIVQALKSKLIICDMDITHCCISKDGLQAIASCLIGKLKVLRNIKVTECKIKDNDFNDFCETLYSISRDLNISISLEAIDLSRNELTSSCVNSILKLLQCCVIEKLIVSNNSINNHTLTDAIFKLACYEGDKIQTLSLSIPLVIINTQTLQLDNSLNDVGQSAGMIFINYEIDKNFNDLILEHSGQVKKIFFMDSIAATDLKMMLTVLQNTLPDITKFVFYERYLKDEVAQKAETYLTKEVKFDISFTLASDTKLLANNSSYHHTAPLLDSNSYINTLHLTNFGMQFPNNGQFVRTLTNTTRNWEMFDLSGSNIRDNGCLELQKYLIASKCTIKDLNVKYNNLSFVSAAAIANLILHCSIKKVDISHNKVQDSQVNDALRCLKRNSINPVCVEIITRNSAMIITSNTNSRHLPSIHKAQLSIMHYFQFEDILLSFNKLKLSQVILQNNGLTLEQIKKIIKLLPFTDLHIEEPYMHYNSNFIDYLMQYLNSGLEKITRENNTISPFSSYSELNIRKSKICLYDIKTLNSVEDIRTNFIPMSAQVKAIKLSNCYVTHDMTEKLAAVIKKSTILYLFAFCYNNIQESDLKLIINKLKSIKSLNVFIIKSINCFSEGTAEGIADIIAGNKDIKYLEFSNCNMKQSLIIKIAKLIKDLRLLKQLNLNNTILTETHEVLFSSLREKHVLKQLNLSHCKLHESEIVTTASTLKKISTSKEAGLTNIDLSYNNITDNAANALASLYSSLSVTQLDLSGCNMLEKGMSQIINALKGRSLKYLNFSDNKITDLLATEISAGICNNPNITSLDLSNCCLQEIGIVEILTSLKKHVSLLTSFKISCSFSNENIVDLFQSVLDKNCKSIENLTLQDCNCMEIFDALRKKLSSLQTLDICSSKISLHNLITIVTNSINLKHLDISNCDIQGDDTQDELDVTDYDLLGLFLEYLDLGGIRITTAFAKFITSLICKRIELKHLNITSCKMEENEMVSITNSLTLLTSLHYLNCSNNVISQQVASNIAKIITNNVNLEHLDISSCLTLQTFLPIANALQQVKGLRFLNISSNCISFEPEDTSAENHNRALPADASVSITQLTKVITCNHFLECLDICDCKLSDLQIANIATALTNTSTLRYFNLGHNEIITDNAADKVASVIANNLSLQNLNLSNCHLQESGNIILAGALAKLTSLVSIDMSKNNITDNCTQSIAAAVKNNSFLEKLNLSNCFPYGADLLCKTKKKGIYDILESLNTLTCLTYLDLHLCYINDEASKLLPVVISNNKSLSYLDLTDCKLDEITLISIAKNLQSTVTLKCLILSSNVVTNEAAHEIASATSNNFSLFHLALSDCELEEEGLMAIAEALLSISSLKHLDFSYNIITDRAAGTLASGIANNTALKYLDLSFCTWQDIGFARINQILNKLPMVKEFNI